MALAEPSTKRSENRRNTFWGRESYFSMIGRLCVFLSDRSVT